MNPEPSDQQSYRDEYKLVFDGYKFFVSLRFIVASLQLPSSMKFLVDKVYLYQTEGGAENWIRVGAYSLGK